MFPAIPQDWEDTGFLRLRAAGGFAVSAARRGGQTEWICVESLAGQPLCLKLPPELAKHRARVHGCTCEWDGEQRLTAAGMAAGERLVVCARGLKSLQFNVPSSPARWGGKKPV